MRCFIAIELPDKVKERLVLVQRDFGYEGISLVKKDALHITISFLGDISNNAAGSIEEELSTVECHSFNVECIGLGFFSADRISAIFARVQKNEGLDSLYESVSAAVKRVVYLREERNFVPHITIARVRKANKADLVHRIIEHEGIDFGEFDVASFSLKKSTLTQDGPIYETLRVFHLEK